MLRSEITITDEDIAYAERILFDKTGCFDDKRITFVKNLETIDLQAVPGSGKTTALLAKLLILERYLPFEDGSGVLVISHTNTAINEIQNKIGKYCPLIFSYPNFYSTIQSFVDMFLALPFYCCYMKGNLSRIDQELFEEQILKRFQDIYWDETAGKPGKWLWSRHIKAAKQQANAPSQVSNICTQSIEREVKNWYFDYGDNILKKKNDGSTVLKDSTNAKFIAIHDMFNNLVIKDGIISFDYAYHFAELYIKKAPIIKRLLQKRFQFVFVDEMQDMDKHQHNLLEQLFYDDGNSSSAYQRIGDKNQAIFSGEVKLEDIWTNRETTLEINGSRRLSPTIAHVVQPFGLTPQVISGDNKINENSSDNNILPHIIEFDDGSVTGVIPKFCELVKQLQEKGRIPKIIKDPIKAIAWVQGGQFGLKDYYPGYAKEAAAKTKIDYPNLISYLAFSRDESLRNKKLNDIRKGIMNALLKILRLEKVKRLEGKSAYYTEASLHKFLKENDFDFYEVFKFNLFLWCKDIYKGNTENVLEAIKEFIPDFLEEFDKTLDQAADFVNDTTLPDSANPETESDPDKPKLNVYRCDKTNIEVQIGTVHSAKGETHTATLYLESYYCKDGRGNNAKSFESQRLKEQFAGKNISHQANDRTKQSAKMIFVGLSRPTHFLCFAAHNNRVDRNVFCECNGWKVVQA